MQNAVALIEYLITGIISFIWIALLSSLYVDLNYQHYLNYKEAILFCLFPIAYVLGIYVDVTSSFLLSRITKVIKLIKKLIPECMTKYYKKLCDTLFGNSGGQPYKHSAEILSHSPSELIKTMDIYVSRDRIARGMALNSLLSICAANLALVSNEKDIVESFFLIFFMISILAWLRLRRLSKVFKIQALKNLRRRRRRS
ncbi:hypothetical protein LCGC14_2952300 [marine sediment metagenome]|uniref:Uncharacterized protein n=1 Tax=marine sediment metagenome TaxID=412755 RepID=A0A0F8Y226_9ZZZZ